MADARKPFFTVSEIRALARAALAEHTALLELSFDQRDGVMPRVRAAEAALSYCSAAIAALDDPELLDLAIELAETEPWGDLYDAATETDGLTRLARHRRVEGKLEELVDHPRPALRHALASGLDVESPRGRSLLQRLTRDADPQVRAEATRRLSKSGPLPWWVGKFEDDPYREMSAEARARHEPAVKALGELLAKTFLQDEDFVRIAELTRDLPDALAAEALDKALVADRYLNEALLEVMAEALARHGEPAASVVERRSRGDGVGRSMAKPYLGALQGEVRERTARRWLAALAERSPARFALDDDEVQAQGSLADALGAHWPEEADPTELLEAALGRFVPEAGWDPGLVGLGKALRRSRRDDVLRMRFRAQLLRGFPGPWDGVADDVLHWFSERPALLPALVEEALAAGAKAGDKVLAWALGHRLTTVYDPARDGPREVFAEALDERPGLSGPLRESHTEYVLGKLRRLLRAGELSADDAARTVKLVGLFRPGVLQGSPLDWLRGEKRAQQPFPRPWALERYRILVNAPAVKEPVTELEWQQLRRARAQGPMGRGPVQLQLEAFPDGPLAPADRAYLEQVRGYLRSEPEPVLAGLAHYVYAMCGELSDLEAMVELEEVRGEDGERWCDDTFPVLRQALRERCGVSPKGGKPKLAVVGGAGKTKPKK